MDFPDGEKLLQFALPMARKIAERKQRARAAGIPIIYVNDNFGRWRSDFNTYVWHCLEAGVRGKLLVELLQPENDPSGVPRKPLERNVEEENTPSGSCSTIKQVAAAALILGQNVSKTSAGLGVDRRTIQRWRKNDLDFQQALGEAKREVILGLSGSCVRGLQKHGHAVPICRCTNPFRTRKGAGNLFCYVTELVIQQIRYFTDDPLLPKATAFPLVPKAPAWKRATGKAPALLNLSNSL